MTSAPNALCCGVWTIFWTKITEVWSGKSPGLHGKIDHPDGETHGLSFSCKFIEKARKKHASMVRFSPGGELYSRPLGCSRELDGENNIEFTKKKLEPHPLSES